MAHQRFGWLRWTMAAGVMPLILVGCATAPSQYVMSSVPQEAGMRFAKITDEEDRVLAPLMNENNGKKQYNPIKFFDVSKDGSKVAYMARKGDKNNLYVKPLNGGKSSLQRTFRENVLDVAFSPDSNQLAFSDYREGSWNIYMVNAEAGSAIRQVTTSRLDENYATFSPDRKSLMFVQTEGQINKEGKPAVFYHYLWMYDLEKGTLTQYAEGRNPNFTPDGRSVVFNRVNSDTALSEIWLMNLENGQEMLLATAKDRAFMEPVVSPDGKQVAFVSAARNDDKNSLNMDVYTINIDGTNLTQLTFHPGDDVCPRWSPDGKSLFFLSQRGSENRTWNIWRMDMRLDNNAMGGATAPAS